MKGPSKGFSVFIIAAIILFTVGAVLFQKNYDESTVDVKVTMKASTRNAYTLYYKRATQKEDSEFSVGQSNTQSYIETGKKETLVFPVAVDTTQIRFDPTEVLAKTQVYDISFYAGDKAIYGVEIGDESLQAKNKGVTIKEDGNGYLFTTTEEDAYVVWNVDSSGFLDAVKAADKKAFNMKKIFAIVIVDSLLLFILIFQSKILEIPLAVIKDRKLVANLAKNDFKKRFAGSYLGIVWAFVQPIITVVVYWFVFQKALNVGTQSTKVGLSVPYVLWLVAGLVPWFYFSDLLATGTSVLMEYSYLVKKVVFNISVLPVVKAISNIYVHVFFVGFTITLYLVYGYFPSLLTFQMIYYSFAMMMLGLGIIYITSAVCVILKDLAQIVAIILQVGVWVTPIMWNIDAMTLSPKVQFVLKLNPMYYIITGYRDTLINGIGFWEHPGETVYFWIVTVILMLLGSYTFKKLRIHFADVL